MFSPFLNDEYKRRKISLTEVNAKCRHLKKFTCKGTFAADVYLSEAQTPKTPLTHYIRVQYYTYSHRAGGRVDPERRGERGNSSGRK
jgi:hypothetical protein